MYRTSTHSIFVVTCLLLAFPDQAESQISFGVQQQNGVVTGGSLVVGGFVNPGRTGVTMGVNAGFRQLIGINTFTFRNGVGGVNRAGGFATNQNQNRRPSAAQFVKAASKFDVDKNGKLDRKELTEVGKAVLAELNQRRGTNPAAVAANAHGGKKDAKSKPPTVDEMVETFVTRSLSFDKDKDESLNNAEATRMAAALIRSLS